MKLKHVLCAEQQVSRDPNEVETKASKVIQTWFFPVGEAIENEVENFLFLKDDLGFASEDTIFPF